MTAIKKIAPAIETVEVSITDAIDEQVEICRDESCKTIEIHKAHGSTVVRGAPPKQCPVCLESIPRGQGAHCEECGWSRRGRTFTRRKPKKGKQDA